MKKTFKRCLIIAMMVCSQIVFAQTTVVGIVATQSESETVDGALVTLLVNDSIVVRQSLTDGAGKFRLDSVPQREHYVIRVTALGYKPERIAILGSEANVNVGYVFLTESSVNLSEVTVYGSGIIEKVDKYIVLPSQEQLNRSGQTLDLLGQIDLPGLSVNKVTQSITVEDRTPVFQINGREQSHSRILNINPNDVLRIEYSNNPGIRYLDRNVSGIINIILKKRASGGSIMAGVEGSPIVGLINGGFTGTYNFNKSEFALSYNANYRDYRKQTYSETESFIYKDINIIRMQNGYESPMYYFTNFLTAEYTYQPDLTTMLTVKVANNTNDQNNQNNGSIEELNEKITKYTRYSKGGGNSNSPSLDIFFSKKLKNNQSIELNVVGDYSVGTFDRNLRYVYSDPVSESLITNFVKNSSWATTGEFAYNKEFKKVATRFGVQYSHNYAKNEYRENDQLSELVSDNAYIYGEVKGKIKKASYSLGTGLKIFSVDNNINNKLYLRNLTTGSILFPLAKGVSLNYLVMYKPNLPSLGQLTPVVQTVDDIVQSMGNPDLTPSDNLYNRILLRYNNNKGFTAAFWVKYGCTFNPIVGTYTYNENTKYFVSSPNNELTQQTYGLQLNLGYRGLFKHIDIFVAGSWDGYDSKGREYHHSLNNFSSSIEVNGYWGNWIVGGEFTITPAKNLIGESVSTSPRTSSLFARYKLGNFHFMARLAYAFLESGWMSESSNLSAIHPSYSKSVILDNRNMLMLGVSYNLNFGKKMVKGQKTLNNGGIDTGTNAVN